MLWLGVQGVSASVRQTTFVVVGTAARTHGPPKQQQTNGFPGTGHKHTHTHKLRLRDQQRQKELVFINTGLEPTVNVLRAPTPSVHG